MEEQFQSSQTPTSLKSGLAKIIITNIIITLIMSVVISFLVSSAIVSQRLAGLAEMQEKVEALTGKIKIQ